MGAFNSPTDLNAVRLREQLVRLAVPLMDSKDTKGKWVQKRGIDVMIAPATALMDLEPIKTQPQ